MPPRACQRLALLPQALWCRPFPAKELAERFFLRSASLRPDCLRLGGFGRSTCHFGRSGFDRRGLNLGGIGFQFGVSCLLLGCLVSCCLVLALEDRGHLALGDRRLPVGLGLGRRLHLLGPEIGREWIAVGFAAGSPGRRAGRLGAAVALGRNVLIPAGVGGDLGEHGVRIGEQMLVGIFLVGLGVLGVGDFFGAALALAFGARRCVERLRLFGFVADRIGAVADILQPFAARVAIDQLDRVEVAGDRRLGLLVGGADQPHHEEEAHHGGHEVGKGDFPDAAVMRLIMVAMRMPDDDDLVRMRMIVGSDRAHVTTPATAADHSASRVS